MTIWRGRSLRAKFVLRRKGGAASASGDESAFFGYKMGPASSPAADGVWAEWTWKNGRFELRNDALGFYPLFYYRSRDGFGVSNDVAELLRSGCPAELDDAAIAVFLRFGFFVGDDTPFKAIRALPPGATLTWDADGFRLESRPAAPGASGAGLSRGAALKRYGELFQAAVESFDFGADDKVALPLSGGRDSRHILFALLKAGRRPDACVTVEHIPPRPNEDARIAAAVTRFDGLNHVVLPRATDLLRTDLEKNRLTQFCADEHAWILPLRSHLRAGGYTAVFDGIGGDILSAGSYLKVERLQLASEGRFREIAEDILGPEGYLAKMIRPDLQRRWSREAAVARVVPELEKRRGAPNPLGQFFFWNRTRREIAASPWGILNDSCHVFAPYLLRDVRGFLESLPASYFVDRSFHGQAISETYPERAHLPFEGGSSPATRMPRAEAARYARDAARHCFFPGGSRRLVNASFFFPRAAKGLLDAEYGSSLHHLFNMAVYLNQLDLLVDGLGTEAPR